MKPDGGFLESGKARVLAGFVALAGLALLAAYNWELMFPPPPPPEAAVSGPPELIACLKERTGAVDKMLADGVVGQAQYAEFRGRAEAFCIGQFGEGGPPAPPQ